MVSCASNGSKNNRPQKTGVIERNSKRKKNLRTENEMKIKEEREKLKKVGFQNLLK